MLSCRTPACSIVPQIIVKVPRLSPNTLNYCCSIAHKHARGSRRLGVSCHQYVTTKSTKPLFFPRTKGTATSCCRIHTYLLFIHFTHQKHAHTREKQQHGYAVGLSLATSRLQHLLSFLQSQDQRMRLTLTWLQRVQVVDFRKPRNYNIRPNFGIPSVMRQLRVVPNKTQTRQQDGEEVLTTNREAPTQGICM